MKKLVVFLVLMVVATIGQQVNGQTSYQKKQLSLLENEINRLEGEIMKDVKESQSENRAATMALERKLHQAEIKADPRRAKSTESLAIAKKEIASLQAQIDSIASLTPETWETSLKREELAELYEERKEMLASWYNQGTSLPQKMNKRTMRRYKNGYEIKREEFSFSKTKLLHSQNYESGKESIYVSAQAEPDLPLITDLGNLVLMKNDYVLPVQIMVKPLNGGEVFSTVLDSHSEDYKYFVPGVYDVTFIVGRTFTTKRMTVDMNERRLMGKVCINYIYQPSRL